VKRDFLCKGKGRKSPKLCPKSCRRFPFDQDRRTFSESVVLKEEEEEVVVKLSSFQIWVSDLVFKLRYVFDHWSIMKLWIISYLLPTSSRKPSKIANFFCAKTFFNCKIQLNPFAISLLKKIDVGKQLLSQTLSDCSNFLSIFSPCAQFIPLINLVRIMKISKTFWSVAKVVLITLNPWSQIQI
jgi:hypothetical protein